MGRGVEADSRLGGIRRQASRGYARVRRAAGSAARDARSDTGAAYQDQNLGTPIFRIEPRNVRRQRTAPQSDVGARVAAASRRKAVVDRREPVQMQRGDRKRTFRDGQVQYAIAADLRIIDH